MTGSGRKRSPRSRHWIPARAPAGKSGAFLLLAERSAQAGTWHWDIPRDRFTWSVGLFELLGLDPRTSRANWDTWRACVHPDDMVETERRVEDSLRARTRLFTQCRIVRPGGEVRWIDAYGDTVYSRAGNPLRMSGVLIDATERMTLEQDKARLEHGLVELKRVERDLRTSEQRLELALGASGLGLWDFHVPSGRLFNDERLCATLGYQPQEVDTAAKAWRRLCHPEDVARLSAAAKAHVTGKARRFQSELRFRHKDGHWVWVSATGQVVERDPNGVPVRVVGTMRDISDQKRLSTEGADLLHRLESLLQDATALGRDPVRPAREPEPADAVHLSPRQRQVLEMIAQGLSSRRIAKRLGISVGTAIGHRRELMRKLDLHSASDVTRYALRMGIVPG